MNKIIVFSLALLSASTHVSAMEIKKLHRHVIQELSQKIITILSPNEKLLFDLYSTNDFTNFCLEIVKLSDAERIRFNYFIHALEGTELNVSFITFLCSQGFSPRQFSPLIALYLLQTHAHYWILLELQAGGLDMSQAVKDPLIDDFRRYKNETLFGAIHSSDLPCIQTIVDAGLDIDEAAQAITEAEEAGFLDAARLLRMHSPTQADITHMRVRKLSHCDDLDQ